MQQADWQGTLWLAPDFAILQGAAGVTAQHAHHAHQLMLSNGTPVTACIDGEPHTARHLLIESLRPHAMVDAPPRLLTIYAEPLRLGGIFTAAQDVKNRPESTAPAVPYCM